MHQNAELAALLVANYPQMPLFFSLHSHKKEGFPESNSVIEATVLVFAR
jgi:hypothetical protein